MFKTLVSRVRRDDDLPDRAHDQIVMKRVLDGTIYDVLLHQFHEERQFSGAYVSIQDRQPSVRTGLCRTVVEDSVALLFGEGRFPAVECEDRSSRAALARLIEDTELAALMTSAAMTGSVGSVALRMRIIGNRVFFDVLETAYLTPDWQRNAPDTLAAVREARKVPGGDLIAAGYAIPPEQAATSFWFRRTWDTMAETWYVPQTLADTQDRKPPVVDKSRTVQHDLGFVPITWIRNLPGGTAIDGACTFRPAIETSIEIDYQLSQAGRGLRYSSDPTLLIKEPASPDGTLHKPTDALIVSEKGDAKLLEIGGTASAAVVDYVRALREYALESIHGNRSSADKVNAAQSGRAMELLHQPLIWLADRLRHSYGRGLLELLTMVVAAQRRYPMKFRDESSVPVLAAASGLSLRWPPWFAQTVADQQQAAGTLAVLVNAGLMSRETAARLSADLHDIDPEAEVTRLTAPPMVAPVEAVP